MFHGGSSLSTYPPLIIRRLRRVPRDQSRSACMIGGYGYVRMLGLLAQHLAASIMSESAVIVQNDESEWGDVKGDQYHYAHAETLLKGCHTRADRRLWTVEAAKAKRSRLPDTVPACIHAGGESTHIFLPVRRVGRLVLVRLGLLVASSNHRTTQ